MRVSSDLGVDYGVVAKDRSVEMEIGKYILKRVPEPKTILVSYRVILKWKMK